MKPRKPHLKRIQYTINVSPTETRTITLRGRRRPRKARLAEVREFNELVKSGALDIREFYDGYIESSPNREISPRERQVIRDVAWLASETEIRKDRKLQRKMGEAGKINKRSAHRLKDHCLKGQFEWVNFNLEKAVLEGKDPHQVIAVAEDANQVRNTPLHALVDRFNSPEKIKRNWRRQLRYFERLMKDKGFKQMTLERERSNLDESVTVVRLTPQGIVRETRAKIFGTGNMPTFTVILDKRGRISYKAGDLASDSAPLN